MLHPFVFNTGPRAEYPVLQFSRRNFEIVSFIDEVKPVDWLIFRGAKGLNCFPGGKEWLCRWTGRRRKSPQPEGGCGLGEAQSFWCAWGYGPTA